MTEEASQMTMLLEEVWTDMYGGL